MAALDGIDRALTRLELAERDGLAAALALLTRYVESAPQVGTRAQAEEGHLPLLRRTQRGAPDLEDVFPGAEPLFVSPGHVSAFFGGDHPRVTVPMIASALLFMGGVVASTIEGRDELRRTPHRNPPGGWIRVSREVVFRLLGGPESYVPVLRGEPGRPPRVVAPEGRDLPSWEQRQAMRVGPEPVRRLVRAYLDTVPSTPFLSVAVPDDRPLLTRRAGRPRAGADDVGLVLDAPLVRVSTLVRRSVTHGEAAECPQLTAGVVRAALATLAQTHAGLIESVRAFSTVDSNGQVQQRRAWVRVHLPGLSLPSPSGRALALEVARWRAAQTQQRRMEAQSAAWDAAADEWRTG